MKTRITKLFGIRHPIVQSGMDYVGFAEMAGLGGQGINMGTRSMVTRDRIQALAAVRSGA